MLVYFIMISKCKCINKT